MLLYQKTKDIAGGYFVCVLCICVEGEEEGRSCLKDERA